MCRSYELKTNTSHKHVDTDREARGAVWKDVAIINYPSLWIYPSVFPPILAFPRHASLLPFSLFLFLPDFVHNQPINPALLFPKPPIPLVSSQLALRQAELWGKQTRTPRDGKMLIYLL